MDHVTRQGLRFDVVDSGPRGGEGVVLLHGFPQSVHCWDEVVPALTASGYRTVVPAQRGYSPGARPLGRRHYLLPELVADVLAVADAAGFERFHVVGHDWGAVVAWQLAAEHPARLLSASALSVPHPMAMARGALRGDQLLRSWYIGAFQLPHLAEAALAAAGPRRIEKALVRGGLPAVHAQRSAELLAQPQAASAMLAWYRALPAALASRRSMGAVRVPALFVWSTRDWAISRRSAEACARFVDAPYRYEVLPGVSHWIPETAPADAAELVLAHLRRWPG